MSGIAVSIKTDLWYCASRIAVKNRPEYSRRNNGKYHLDHAVSKKQRILLSAFGMDDQDIRRLATTISKLLATNQSLLSDDMIDQEEEDYGEDAFDDFD